MKRWAVITVALYATALLLLTAPVCLIAFGAWGKNPETLSGAVNVYSWLGFWIWLAVLVAGQSLFLLLPIDISERRLPARRSLKSAKIITTFFLANLFFAGFLSIVLAVWSDATDGPAPQLSPFRSVDANLLLNLLVYLAAFWILWAFIFQRFARSDDPESLVQRATRWLLRGSILELLIAVPSHIIVRRRGDCCAPIGTFWGIATGISVMLLCFGPGVYFLFVERFRRLQSKGVRK